MIDVRTALGLSDHHRVPEITAERRWAAGEVVFSEGDDAACAYVIVAGHAEISVQGRWRSVPVASAGPGEVVGHIGLLDGRRTATMTAVTELVAVEVPGELILGAMEQDGRFRQALTAKRDELLIADFIRSVGPFGSLDSEERNELAGRLRPREVAEGEDIVRAGEAATVAYVLRSGRADVVAPDGSVVATVGPGDVIGETALLTGGSRSATVSATEPCSLLELRHEDLAAIQARRGDVTAELEYLSRLRSRPRRDEDVIAVEHVNAEGDVVTTLKHPRHVTYFRLSPRGRFLWDSLDGRRNLRDLTVDVSRQLGLTLPTAVVEIVAGLERAGMLAGSEPHDARGPADAAWWRRWLARARASMEVTRELPGNADRFFDALYRRGGRLLMSSPALVLWGALAASGMAAFAVILATRAGSYGHHAASVAVLAPAMIVAILIHEASHGLAVKHHGRTVHRAGVGLHWLTPCAFVDTSDMWLASARARAAVAAAGPVSGLVLGGALSLAAVASGDAGVAALLWSASVPIIFFTLMNVMPFLELDGYHILCDLTDRPNLRAEAVRWLRRERGRRRAPGLALYLVASGAFLAFTVVFTLTAFRSTLQGWADVFVQTGAAVAVAWVLCTLNVLLILAAVAGELLSERGVRG